MSKFRIDQKDILAATNGGLDIMRRFFELKPDIKKHFKIRKEGTESANLSQIEGVWFVKDWGDYGGFFQKSQNAISVYAHFNGLGYFEALVELAKDLGLVSENEVGIKYFSSCKLHQFEGELNEDDFCYKTKDFTEYELEALGPIVTQEVCAKYNLVALESYSWLKSDGMTQRELCDVYTISSTPTYPIFAIINKTTTKPKLELLGEEKTVSVTGEPQVKEWLKIIQPKAKDKKYRFSYLGKKPKDHIFGLEQLEKAGAPKIFYDVDEETGEQIRREEENKIENVVICSGDRDAINMASCGYQVLWFNSETVRKEEIPIKLFYKYAKNVINVPDLDPTGFEAGKTLALAFLDVKTAWLPNWLLKEKDWRGNPMKDFTDFIRRSARNIGDLESNRNNLIKIIDRLIELARPGRFWDISWSKKGPSYSINYKNAFNFLKLNGFFRIKDESRDEGFYFVKQDGHIIREVRPQEIKDFFNKFLDEKQQEEGLKYFPDDLLNMLIGTEAMSDKRLINIQQKEFDFTDYTDEAQYLFFKNFIWEVKADGITEITKGYSRYVLERNLIDSKIKATHSNSDFKSEKVTILPPMFKIGRDAEKNYTLEILETGSHFMNYLISGSRVFWDEEMKGLTDEEQCQLKKSAPCILNSEKLTEEQVYTQEMHFINKCYAIGYLLHSSKSMSKAWAIVGMDDRIVDNHKSHGRTGKSLLYNGALRCLKPNVYKGARRKDVLEGQFIYEGVTRHTDYLLFDDANDQFRFDQIFTDITGDMNVNRKNKSELTVGFYESPKIVITTNFAFRNLDSSSNSRMLINSFSDFFHGNNSEEGRREFSPREMFGVDFFSKDWPDEQWNMFLNFMAQCLSFYLGCTEKIEAPMENIRKRNLMADLGNTFIEWADDFFENQINKFILKDYAYNDLKAKSLLHKSISATTFKQYLLKFCELRGYVFNPEHETRKKDAAGRYMIAPKGEKNGKEHILIGTKNQPDETAVPEMELDDKNLEEDAFNDF